MAIKVVVTLTDAVALLQRLIQADPDAAARLLLDRVPCAPALRDTGVGVVIDSAGGVTVGLLGLLNGLFGTDQASGLPAISVLAQVGCSTNPQHPLPTGLKIGAPCTVEGCDGEIRRGRLTGAGLTGPGLVAIKRSMEDGTVAWDGAAPPGGDPTAPDGAGDPDPEGEA